VDFMAKSHPAGAPTLCVRFHGAIELIGRRWTGAIIFLLLESRCRFATLRDAIPDITDRMLSERLQELEAEGIVERTVVPDTPVKVEYSLTRKGRALAAAIDAVAGWAHDWIPLEPPAAKAGKAPRARSARLTSQSSRYRSARTQSRGYRAKVDDAT
jgi:DNA-binding HxlR family transcriptional regulator